MTSWIKSGWIVVLVVVVVALVVTVVVVVELMFDRPRRSRRRGLGLFAHKSKV
jgi:hypothetical protein